VTLDLIACLGSGWRLWQVEYDTVKAFAISVRRLQLSCVDSASHGDTHSGERLDGVSRMRVASEQVGFRFVRGGKNVRRRLQLAQARSECGGVREVGIAADEDARRLDERCTLSEAEVKERATHEYTAENLASTRARPCKSARRAESSPTPLDTARETRAFCGRTRKYTITHRPLTPWYVVIIYKHSAHIIDN
jgi:hypothetical protein